MKDFDTWNNVKKVIDRKVVGYTTFFNTRDIWWCSLGLNIGVESNGKNESFERPVVILKVFNRHMIWCLPLTSTIKDSLFYYKINIDGQDQSVMLTQIRIISSKRLLRKVGVIGENDFKEIKNILTSIIQNESPLSGAISEAEATNDSIINEGDLKSRII